MIQVLVSDIILICAVPSTNIMVNIDYRFVSPEWLCSVGLLREVVQPSLDTMKAKNKNHTGTFQQDIDPHLLLYALA